MEVPGAGPSEGGEAGGGGARRGRRRGGRRQGARRDAVRARLRALLRRAVVKHFVLQFQALFEPRWACHLAGEARKPARERRPEACGRREVGERVWATVFWWALSAAEYDRLAGRDCARPPAWVPISDYPAAYREYLRDKYERWLVHEAQRDDYFCAERDRRRRRTLRRHHAWEAATSGMTADEVAAFAARGSERYLRRQEARFAAEVERERYAGQFFGGAASDVLGTLGPLSDFDVTGELTGELEAWERGSSDGSVYSDEGDLEGDGEDEWGDGEGWGSEGELGAEFDGCDGADL